MDRVEEITELAKRRGFFWSSFSIYGGLAGFYDYGPLGTAMKEKILSKWISSYRKLGAIFIDTPTLAPEVVFQASGHLEKFADPAAECTKCGSRFKLESLGVRREDFDSFLTNKQHEKVFCKTCGSEITKFYSAKQMFQLTSNDSRMQDLYLRPETAQGMMLGFPLLLNFNRGKLPLYVSQVGKSYRNEVAPRQALLRMREFTQLELEAYYPPNDTNDYYNISKEKITIKPSGMEEMEISPFDMISRGIISNRALAFFIGFCSDLLISSGIEKSLMRFRQHDPDERAHYSRDSWDAEVKIGEEWVEVQGIADRGNYDLTRHSTFSKVDLTVDTGNGKEVPRIVEPALGVDRLIFSILSVNYLTRENGNKYLRLPPDISPYSCAVLPLQKKDGIDSRAREFFAKYILKDSYAFYDESGSIGRRYARQDEIGTPVCVTFDYDSLKNPETVTVRFRDDTSQIRIATDLILQAGNILNLPEIKKKFNY